MRRTYLRALAVGFLLTVPGWAQEDEDGPGRGVARLSLINGDVSVRRGDSGDWVAAAPNAPLVVEDHVLTGANSRAEVQFDWANLLRLSSNTDVRLAELENRRYQAQVASGTVTMSVLRESDADVSIDTPNVSVRPVKRGTYRVAVLEDGETEVTVRSGEVEIYTPRGVERLKSGRTMMVRGTQADPEFQVLEARNRDEWDRWNEERDRRLERTKSYAYVSRDIYGAEELDGHGTWIYEPPYGYVWRPYYSDAGWAPYRQGRWVWVDWYGWTWVSYDPWGWAPYHYGRWFHGTHGWCWYPGPRHYRHYWRPALVAFVGFNAGPVHVGVGFGRIGWVPLAPYERYYPWYGRNMYRGYRGGGYVDNSVRIVNNVNITNVYRNSRVRNGMSGMDYNDFGRGGRARAFTNEEIRVHKTSVVQGALPVAPQRESLRLADREVRTPMGRSRTPERFYTRREPAKVERVSFADQQRGMQGLARRTFGGEPSRSETAGGPAGWRGGGEQRREAGMAPGRTGEPAQTAGGWRRLGGDNAPGRVERNAETQAGGQAAGWRGNQAGAERGELRGRERQENNWRRFGGRANSEARNEAAGGAAVRSEPGSGRGAAAQTEPASGGWRGREDVRRDEVRNAPARQENDNSWRRFGGRTEAGSRSEERTRPETGRGDLDGGWRGNGGMQRQESSGGAERSEPRRMESPRYEPREMPRESPRWSAPEDRGGRTWSRPERSEPVRINPPIVRERGGDSGWRGNSGGAQRSEGGGGGGWRGNSGGGGGQRSEGGGQRSEGGGGGRRRDR